MKLQTIIIAIGNLSVSQIPVNSDMGSLYSKGSRLKKYRKDLRYLLWMVFNLPTLINKFAGNQ